MSILTCGHQVAVVPSDLSSTSSCEDWGKGIAFAQIYTHTLYLPFCKQLNQNKFSLSTKIAILSYFTIKRTEKRIVYSSARSPISMPV